MNERQRKVLVQSLTLVGAASATARRAIDKPDASFLEAKEKIDGLYALVAKIKESVDASFAASDLLDRVSTARESVR